MATETQAPRRLPKRGAIFLGLVALVAAVALGAWLLNRGKESTDDAFLEAHILEVSPKISEKILAVHVEDNQTVKKGDLLVELDPSDAAALVRQAEANLDSAEAKLAQSKAELASAKASFEEAAADVREARATSDNAQKELVRSRDLSESGAIAQRELDNAVASAQSSKAAQASKEQKAAGAASDVTVAEAAVRSAQAQGDQAQAMLDTAKLRLSYTRIAAPENGRVTRKSVEKGNYVQTGTPLLAIVPEDVWVVANFKETQLTRMRPGQRVDIHVDAYPKLKLTGHVDSIQAGTGARFSLLPSENATGNYVKVVQRVPTKILLDEVPSGTPLLAPGMSVIPTVFVE